MATPQQDSHLLSNPRLPMALPELASKCLGCYLVIVSGQVTGDEKCTIPVVVSKWLVAS